jgi:hypothetical protein
MQPWSTPSPAVLTAGGGPLVGVSGTVVVVVVVGGNVVVVVVVLVVGAVVGTGNEGTVGTVAVRTIVVVVVLVLVVVLVGAVVVGVLAGAVVVVVVVLVDVLGWAVAEGAGEDTRVAVVQAPACCKVDTSSTRRAKDLSSAVSSNANLAFSWATALVAAARWLTEAAMA